MRTTQTIVIALCLTGAGAALAKAKPAKKPPPPPKEAPAPYEPADVLDPAPYKDKLQITTDGKGHYLATPPSLDDEALRGTLFWSPDGKLFWQQRVGSFGGSGSTEFSLSFWEPRVNEGYKRSFDRKDAVYTLQCDDRLTDFKPLPADQQKTMLAGATFLKPRWKYQAYALARDDSGRYFYVDRQREPPQSKMFRLYMGKKGEMKPLKMTNVVSDSEGDIFATKTGELRLIIPRQPDERSGMQTFGEDGPRKDPVWVQGKGKLPLTWVPVEDNAYMIYAELGVYTGQLLGTPCDDL
jgi:hypothetical protein